MTPGLPVPWGALGTYLAVLALQRVAELVLSARNMARLTALGGHEVSARHFPLFVLLHVGYPVALVAEAMAGARPSAAWPWALGVWLLAQVLRVAAIRALGARWNVRIVVLPGEPPVRSGIYRWLRHPNYVAVVLEFLSAPLMFGAWRTCIAATVLNAAVLAVRIPAEERALEEAVGKRPVC